MDTEMALTIPEACRAAKISRAAFYKAWRAGCGPKVRSLGRKRLILVEDLREWLRGLS